MGITLRDIAEEAGVSLMTVSNVVNGKRARVSQRTIDRVQDIVARTGYVPNASARSLAARSSKVIGVLVPAESDESLLVSAHTSDIVGSLERLLRQRDYHLLLRGVAHIGEIREAVQAWNLDGAILIGINDDDLHSLDNLGDLPVIAVDSYAAERLTGSVRADDVEGGRLAALHLLSHGHRRILFAGPSFEHPGVVSHRHEGFLRAHEEAGVAHPPELLATEMTTYEDGLRLGRELHVRYPDATAVFATADILAIGLMAGVRAAGRRVPEHVSVVGFDDIAVAAYVAPRLTTVAQDLGRKAHLAAQMLLDAIDDTAGDSHHAIIEVQLIERESVATLPITADHG